MVFKLYQTKILLSVCMCMHSLQVNTFFNTIYNYKLCIAQLKFLFFTTKTYIPPNTKYKFQRMLKFTQNWFNLQLKQQFVLTVFQLKCYNDVHSDMHNLITKC